MNYMKIYGNIIKNAQTKYRVKGKGEYFEKHHIIPKCQGGTNNPNNLVLLTAREHYLCHKLLQMANPHSRELAFAYQCMITRKTGERKVATAKEYEYCRIKIAKLNEEYFKHNPGNRKGSHQSQEAIEQQKAKLKIYYENLSPEDRQLWVDKFSGENSPTYGIPRTEEVKEKISDATSSEIIYAGEKYSSVKVAARKLNMNEKAIRSKIIREEEKGNPDYKYMEHRIVNMDHSEKMKPVLFNGVKYKSLTEVGKKINRTQPRIKQIMEEEVAKGNPLFKYL